MDIFSSICFYCYTTYAKAAAKEKELVNQELKGGKLSEGRDYI
jgi:hypothetical protein